MFTGIIEVIGKIADLERKNGNLELRVASEISKFVKIDESISHNGVCLTVVECDSKTHRVTIIEETIHKTAFNNVKIGDLINLERSLKIGDRLSGHFVQGHVDGTSRCLAIGTLEGSHVFRFGLEPEYALYIVQKGSVCVNGTSLTVSDLGKDFFEVSIIPYTYQNTNLKTLNVGDLVNIEFDVLGKYIVRSIEQRNHSDRD